MIATVVSGFGTIVEASALGCAYALFVEMVVFRTIRPVKDLPRVLVTASTLVGAVVILLGVAMGLSSYLVDAEVPTLLLEWTTTHVKSPWVFLLALNVGLLLFGSVLEIYAAIVVLAPLVAPIGVAYGIDPVHLGRHLPGEPRARASSSRPWGSTSSSPRPGSRSRCRTSTRARCRSC